ncbi:hypothetical protein ACROYT_G039909 [Oculina patagonica]
MTLNTDFQYNLLKAITKEVKRFITRDCPSDLTNNQITHIAQEDLEHFDKLQKVYLKGNPFHCDCNLKWLRLKLNNSPAVIQDGDSVKCATPLKFHNKALKSLSNLCAQLFFK